jgi:hypothetical protein
MPHLSLSAKPRPAYLRPWPVDVVHKDLGMLHVCDGHVHVWVQSPPSRTPPARGPSLVYGRVASCTPRRHVTRGRRVRERAGPVTTQVHPCLAGAKSPPSARYLNCRKRASDAALGARRLRGLTYSVKPRVFHIRQGERAEARRRQCRQGSRSESLPRRALAGMSSSSSTVSSA